MLYKEDVNVKTAIDGGNQNDDCEPNSPHFVL